MLDAILARFDRLAADWSKEVERRRRVTKADPVADTLDYVAGELTVELAQLREDCRTLTPEQYGALKGVSAQSVRNWIRDGELEALRGARGWLIPAAAARRKKTAPPPAHGLAESAA